MTEVTIFQTGFRMDDSQLQPGDIFRKGDGTVWLVNPDSSQTQIVGGGGGGLPAGWTQSGNPADVSGHAGSLAFDDGSGDTSALTGERLLMNGPDSYISLEQGEGISVAPVSPFAAFTADPAGGGLIAFNAGQLAILGPPLSEFDDALVSAGDNLGFWFDPTDGAPVLWFKGATSDGTIVTIGIPLSPSGGVFFSGWTSDFADPSVVSTNGGSLFMDDGTNQAIYSPTQASISDDGAGQEGYFIGVGLGIQSASPADVPAFQAQNADGATVALDCGGLTIINLPTSDPHIATALYTTGGAVLVSAG